MKNMVIKNFVLICAAFAVCVSASAQEAKKIPTEIPAVEFTERGGVPNFYAKLKAGKAVKVGYFGGSITSQPGWRVHSLNYFKEKFPNADISEINAAIGGTGSDLGAFRLQRDVLSKKPDLVFVEFAVNDGGVKAEAIVPQMEGIVRQIWKADASTDICFVYTMTFRDLERLQQGRAMPSSAVMEYISEYYKIPSINMALEVVKLEKEGKLVMRTDEAPVERPSGTELDALSAIPLTADGKIPFSKDGVHPFPNTGHVVYMVSVKKAFDKMFANAAKPAPHKLAAPIDADNYENVKSVPIESPHVKLGGTWQKLSYTTHPAKQFENRTDALYRLEPSATMEFKFKGRKLAIYDLLGAGCGEIEVELDGVKTKEVRMDGYCNYYRLALLKIGGELEDKVHTVKITVLDTKLDKREILFERNRDDYDKRPTAFERTDFYPALIYIVGEML